MNKIILITTILMLSFISPCFGDDDMEDEIDQLRRDRKRAETEAYFERRKEIRRQKRMERKVERRHEEMMRELGRLKDQNDFEELERIRRGNEGWY